MNSDCEGLRLRLFGNTEVCINGSDMPPLRSRKGLWLLAILALHRGRDVDRGWLAGTLWPDNYDADARRSLRQSLHDLRVALGAESWRITSAYPSALKFNITGASVDVAEFDAAISRGDTASLQLSVRLYRGPLVEDCVEDWCLDERRSREDAYITALTTLASEAIAKQDYQSACNYLRLAVCAHPYREELQRSLMESLVSIGESGGAISHYRQYREKLWREMGIAPEAATIAIFRQILDRRRTQACIHATSKGSPDVPMSHDFTHIRRRVGGPSYPLTELIGRDAAVQEVVALLTTARLVTLTGTGGVGKTRLATKVALEIDDEYEDGTHFAMLASLANSSSIPDAIREALGVSPVNAGQDVIETLKNCLVDRQLLLVLDNCEHLMPAAAEVADCLLRTCPRLRILATSRHALGLPGESVWRVPSLVLPPLGEDQTADRADGSTTSPAAYAAVRLFLDRARAAESTFKLTPRNASAIVKVCRRLDGIPLAIELIAARTRALSIDEINTRLHKGYELVAGAGTANVSRHQTLAAAFDWSWNLLTPSERTVLMRFTVFCGGCSLDAAEKVCSGVDIQPGDIVELLTSLVDKSLIVYLPTGVASWPAIGEDQRARYRLLETIRGFAADRLRSSIDCHMVRKSHRDYYLEWAEEVKPRLWGPDQAYWFGLLELEHDNLRAAIDWSRSHDGDAEQHLRLAVALSRFWDTRGYVKEGRAQLETALARTTGNSDNSLRAKALRHVGWMAYLQGDCGAARGYYAQALRILTECGSEEDAAYVLNDIGCAALDEGDLIAAKALFEESLERRRKLGMPASGATLNNLGGLAIRMGNFDEAIRYLDESISQCRAVGGKQQQHGITLLNLSVAKLRQQRLEEAQADGVASLRLLYDCGATVNLNWALSQLALVASSMGQWEHAVQLLGSTEGLRVMGGDLPVEHASECATVIEMAKCALGAEEFAIAFATGGMMNSEQAVEHALRFAG
jgi:predicted ATPase/DNA-binding SARP family transcriptional activator